MIEENHRTGLTRSSRPSAPTMEFASSEHWYEGAPLGNGDLGTMVFSEGGSLAFGVGKNDVWDRRMPELQPKPVCRLHLDLPVDDAERPRPPQHRLSLEEAELTTDLRDRKVVTRVQKDRNVLFIRLSQAGQPSTVRLSRTPDQTDTGIAPPRLRAEGPTGIIVQDLPPEATYPDGFRYAVAARVEAAPVPAARSGEIRWDLAGGDAVLALAVATSRDADDPETEAIRLLDDARAAGDAKLREEHDRLWRDYWSRSWIRIDDTETQDLWYQWMYVFGSATAPGATAPGLFSPWILNDKTKWKGAYTIDYNFEQTYAAALSSNRPEMMAPYFAEVERNVPRARRLAREKYGTDGLAFPHQMAPADGEDSHKKNSTLGETVWLLQHFWEHYLHTLDTAFLADRAYPLIREVADWIVRWVVEEDDGSYGIPAYESCEHPEPPGARNGTPELGFARYLLRAAIEAAGILEQDRDRAAEWEKVLENLAPYPTVETQAGTVFVDCEPGDPAFNVAPPPPLLPGRWRPSKETGNHGAWMYYNLPNPLIPVWPAGQLDMHSPESPADEVLTAIRTWMTLKLEGCNNLVSHHVIAARLGINSYREFKRDVAERRLPNGFITTKCHRLSSEFDYDSGYFAFNTYGIFTENCGIPLVLNEIMLQSHHRTIHVFPCFDPYLKAEFHRLRARGAFLVSAEIDRGFVRWVEIEPTVAGTCRVRPPWPRERLRLAEAESGAAVETRNDGREIAFSAQPGTTYRLTPETKINDPGTVTRDTSD